jgi:hypothetical protein
MLKWILENSVLGFLQKTSFHCKNAASRDVQSKKSEEWESLLSFPAQRAGNVSSSLTISLRFHPVVLIFFHNKLYCHF